jgi:threonine dehydrogenase-like Zn-dependent dehydrogenase
MNKTMRAALLYAPDSPMKIERVDVPALRAHDVLVQVKACGIVPNMNYVFSGRLGHRLPPLPAVLGLDAAGIVVGTGDEVADFVKGDRVYINPMLRCGSCPYCAGGGAALCRYGAFRGYFGFSPESEKLLKQYPCGGFAEYTPAAASTLVRLAPEVTFEQAARFGYLGTAYAALKRGGVGPASWVAINGVTGTVGVGAVLWALAMGATRILGFGRNRALLEQVKALAPGRVDTLALGERDLAQWVREHTDGLGVDVLLDCTGRGSGAQTTVEALGCLKHGGTAMTVGAVREPVPLDPYRFMNTQLAYRGSNWFTVRDGLEMVELARSGVVDLGVLKPVVFPLDRINEGLAQMQNRPGGFTNLVVAPDR